MYYILRKRMEELKKAREKFYLVINSMLLKKTKNKKAKSKQAKKKGVE